MDPQAVVSLAQVQVLLVPIGPIGKGTFDKWVSMIRGFDAVKLEDIPRGMRGEKGESLVPR